MFAIVIVAQQVQILYDGKSRLQVFLNKEVITGDMQRNLVVVDLDKINTWWNTKGQRRNVAKLGDEPYRQLSECRVKEIMSDNNHDLCGSIKEGELKACDEVCGYKKDRKCNANTSRWNSVVRNKIQNKKEANK